MNSWITISLAESPSLCWMLNYWNSRNPGLASESNIFYLLALFLDLVSLVPRRFITGYSCILLIYCCLFISYSSISFCLIYFLWGKTCLLCLVNGLKISLDRTTKTWSYFCNYYYILHIHFFKSCISWALTVQHRLLSSARCLRHYTYLSAAYYKC